MSEFDINFGPWINYGNSDKKNKVGEKMRDLTSESWSPFNGFDYAQVFIFCMAYAFAKGRVPVAPPSKGGGSMPASAFKADMRDLMKAVAISHTGELDIITRPNDVVRICEEFAYAAFLEVYNKIKNRDPAVTADMVLESLIKDIEDRRNR